MSNHEAIDNNSAASCGYGCCKAVLLVLILLTNLAVSELQAQQPISYQGVLNDDMGNPIDDVLNSTFNLYDSITGGNILWTETQSIEIINGIFNVQLGGVNPIPSGVFEYEPLYLGVSVGTDPEMTPRQLITASAFSRRANTAAFRLKGAPVIGGLGHDGDFLSSGSDQFERGRVYEFSSFVLQAGHSITATGGPSNAVPIVIKVQGDCLIEGTIDLQGAGMPRKQDLPGTLQAGFTSSSYFSGGGGAGSAGGGLPGNNGPGNGSNPGPPALWLSNSAFGIDSALAGAGGGDRGSVGGATGGAGGPGGGALILSVGGNLEISGEIDVSGGPGQDGTLGGGGGGGGSAIIYHKGRAEISLATFTYNGGAGGLGGPRGGAGGSGKVMIIQVSDE